MKFNDLETRIAVAWTRVLSARDRRSESISALKVRADVEINKARNRKITKFIT